MAGRASVERVRDRATGLDKFVLREARGSFVEVYLYGGQVTSWKNNFGEQQLFVSRKLGNHGVGNHGVLEQHGFARNRLWSVDESPPFPDTTFDCHIDLILKQSEEDLKIWPHSYERRLQVALSPTGDLILTSRIKNNIADGKPFQFSFAYHTYFSVSDIRIYTLGNGHLGQYIVFIFFL